jgi:hypothetical protein
MEGNMDVADLAVICGGTSQPIPLKANGEWNSRGVGAWNPTPQDLLNNKNSGEKDARDKADKKGADLKKEIENKVKCIPGCPNETPTCKLNVTVSAATTVPNSTMQSGAIPHGWPFTMYSTVTTTSTATVTVIVTCACT